MSRKWVWVAVLAIPVAFLGWIAHGIIAFATADNRIPEGVSAPCSEAMRFVDKDGLPTGAHDATCTVRTWLDTQYAVAFHISQADLDRWLASDYPGTKLESGYRYPDTVDACAHIETGPVGSGRRNGDRRLCEVRGKSRRPRALRALRWVTTAGRVLTRTAGLRTCVKLLNAALPCVGHADYRQQWRSHRAGAIQRGEPRSTAVTAAGEQTAATDCRCWSASSFVRKGRRFPNSERPRNTDRQQAGPRTDLHQHRWTDDRSVRPGRHRLRDFAPRPGSWG